MPKKPDHPPAPSERERLEWLLVFLRTDVETMRPGELLDLRDDVMRLRQHGAAVDMLSPEEAAAIVAGDFIFRSEGRQQHFTGDPLPRMIASSRELLSELQESLRAGIAALERTGRWRPFTERSAPRWELVRHGSAIARHYTGSVTQVFMASAADLLTTWWPRLRRCKHEPCRTLFLPSHGKKEYHDPKCSQQARWVKFAPKRERDYHEEYARRHRRKGGVGRPRRRKTKGPTRKGK